MQRRASIIGILVLTSIGAASWVAQAELVFDPMTSPAPQVAQHDSPSNVGTQVIVAPQQQVSAPAAQAAPSIPSSEGLSMTEGLESSASDEVDRQTAPRRSTRAELLHRERMREEIKNEDVLRARLEELRLREEQRLHDRLLRDERDQVVRDTAPVVQAAPVQVVEVVKTPVTEQKAESVAQVPTSFLELGDPMNGTNVSVSPTAGAMIFTQQAYGFDVRSRFSLGAAVAVAVGDHFGVEGAYHFNQFGISTMTSNPFVNQLVGMNAALAQPFATESIVMNQHMADMGMRVYLLSRSQRIRPFISGGMSYGFSSTNYNAGLVSSLTPYGLNLNRPYELHTLYGQLGAGVDFQVTRNISLGVAGRYYAPFAAWQSNAVQYNGYYLFGADRAIVGGTLGAMPMMAIQGSASFTF